jgi:UDP-N-acetylmuramoyl-L-alanyl-D-glutamate--2,6-diaminopimelate ligase
MRRGRIMLIDGLIEGIKIKKIIGDIKNLEINEINYDSKKINQNDVFFCLKGENSDGHNYAKDAVSNGAIILICEKEVDIKIPQIIVENSRKAFSIVAGISMEILQNS